MKAVHVLLGGLVVTAVCVPFASARPAYRTQAIEQLKLADKDGKADSVSCAYCHQAASGGRNWNKWGDAIKAQLAGDAKGNIGDALYLALKADKDSDGDGFTDVLEVVAKTLPGDEKSKPDKSKEDLAKMLKDMGGVDAFKPKAK
jgi:hypothetical protein